MSLLFNFYHCICDFLCHSHSFNPSLCHLSLFLQSCVAVSSHVGFQVIIFYVTVQCSRYVGPQMTCSSPEFSVAQ